MGDLVPRNTLVKQALVGVGGIVGGIALFSLGSGPVGLVLGIAAAAVGLLVTVSKKDRGTGLVLAGAGALALIANLKIPILGGIAGFLLGAGAISLLVAGGYSLYKFIKNLLART